VRADALINNGRSVRESEKTRGREGLKMPKTEKKKEKNECEKRRRRWLELQKNRRKKT
jgi:hypothetical protein